MWRRPLFVSCAKLNRYIIFTCWKHVRSRSTLCLLSRAVYKWLVEQEKEFPQLKEWWLPPFQYCVAQAYINFQRCAVKSIFPGDGKMFPKKGGAYLLIRIARCASE